MTLTAVSSAHREEAYCTFGYLTLGAAPLKIELAIGAVFERVREGTRMPVLLLTILCQSGSPRIRRDGEAESRSLETLHYLSFSR